MYTRLVLWFKNQNVAAFSNGILSSFPKIISTNVKPLCVKQRSINKFYHKFLSTRMN